MKLQQLRVFREVVRRGFDLQDAAEVLFTAPSGLLRHIGELEQELGVALFQRRDKEIVALTDPGKEILAITERIMFDMANIQRVGDQFTKPSEGLLVIATTHTQARYTLPEALKAFRKEFPMVRIDIVQLSGKAVEAALQEGKADIGIVQGLAQDNSSTVTFPFCTCGVGLVLPKGHPLSSKEAPELSEIASYPILVAHGGAPRLAGVHDAFDLAGLTPNIAMSMHDADLAKYYVRQGLGIALVTTAAWTEEDGSDLALVSLDHIFDRRPTRIAVRKGKYLREFDYRFIALCNPSLQEAQVREAVMPEHLVPAAKRDEDVASQPSQGRSEAVTRFENTIRHLRSAG